MGWDREGIERRDGGGWEGDEDGGIGSKGGEKEVLYSGQEDLGGQGISEQPYEHTGLYPRSGFMDIKTKIP